MEENIEIVLLWAKEELKLSEECLVVIEERLVQRAGYYNWDIGVMKMEVGKWLGWSCV
jgi:hypothetical protein